jgi:FtsK/SpoIIIE family
MADPYTYPAAAPRRRRPDVTEVLLAVAVRIVVDHWLELSLPALLAVPAVAAVRTGWGWPGCSLEAAVVCLLVAIGPVRRWFGRLLYAAWIRRRFVHAVEAARIVPYAGQRPTVRQVRAVPAGELLTVRVPVGGTVADLDTAAEQIAVALELREVRVTRCPDNARQAAVALVRRDPLAGSAPPWPHLAADRLSLWDPIPVGVDENGEQVEISLPERNVLLGGEPGAGKSASLSLLVATAALDPTVRLHLFDGKLVELAAWAGCADSTVGTDTAVANKVLRELQLEMEQRYLTLLANRARKVTREGGLPLHVLVVDELAHYLLAPDRKVRTEFAELLRDLVARGRAAGLIVLAATQKPAHDIIPTALRDLFGFRWALRCMTPQASDTVLGAGWASLGYSAADIDAAQRGVGWLLHEGGQPLRLRCHYLDDAQLAGLAERAEALRRQPSGAVATALTHPVESP